MIEAGKRQDRNGDAAETRRCACVVRNRLPSINTAVVISGLNFQNHALNPYRCLITKSELNSKRTEACNI